MKQFHPDIIRTISAGWIFTGGSSPLPRPGNVVAVVRKSPRKGFKHQHSSSEIFWRLACADLRFLVLTNCD